MKISIHDACFSEMKKCVFPLVFQRFQGCRVCVIIKLPKTSDPGHCILGQVGPDLSSRIVFPDLSVSRKIMLHFSELLSCNVPGRSVTTLLPGGSCWGLVTVEEIVGGYLNAFSCSENVFRGRQ